MILRCLYQQVLVLASSNTRHRQVNPNYLTSFRNTTHKLISTFQVTPGLCAPIWKCYHYFEDHMTRVCCNECGSPIKVQNGISGLTSHLKGKHTGVQDITGNKRKCTPSADGAGQLSIRDHCAPVVTEEELQEKIKGDACEWLQEDMLPTSIAESEAFCKFLKKAISNNNKNLFSPAIRAINYAGELYYRTCLPSTDVPIPSLNAEIHCV
jgi:hypothetical protein